MHEQKKAALEAGAAYKNKRINCPHCGEEVLLGVEYRIDVRPNKAGVGDQTQTTSEGYWRSTQSQEILREIDAMSPMIETWRKIFTQVHGAVPKLAAKAFLAWTRVLQPKPLPPEVNRFFSGEYPGQSCRIVHSNGIAAILVEDVLTQLIPTTLLDGDALKGQAGVIRSGRTDISKIENWIRTKYGYVAGSGTMLTELRKRCYGAFDQPGVTS
jgi:hypothetical protein